MIGWLLLLLPMTYTWAQNPADFFDHKKERRMKDSLYEAKPDISREEMRAFMKEYHQKQADAYYQAYRRRIAQQEKAEKFDLPQNRARLQNNFFTQNNVANSAASEGQVPDAVEYAALEALYNATEGENWRYNDNWLQGTTNADFANWYGIEVENGDVSSIQLWYNNLTGPLPSSIADLANLQRLELGSNHLSSLPPELANLSNLKILNVSRNQLGSLAIDFSKFSKLQKLWIYGNSLNEIPESITTLSQLQDLHIGQNPITYVPSGIGNLTNLQELNINNSKLSSLPDDIIHLTNLNVLHLHGCNFSLFPAVVCKLTSLQELQD